VCSRVSPSATRALGAVMSAAVMLHLLVAATSGVLVPLTLHALGRDPAHGFILVTFMTDAGFFLFLGLATLFLL
jgi:magnesium transporter